MADYIFSKKAVEDLSRIWNYTFDSWSEKQADKYYQLVLDSCVELAAGKVAGKPYPETDNEILGCRIMQHIIFYRSKNKGQIEIVRILHGSMDLKSRVSE
ncbi:MAG: type toxin-antitoxin system RelE/ParE family toxin [Ferruginibacter sp.]|nr:type toxin-antitoxin system RelE/ParE family toxin [Ferruginibacter sp.]